MSSPLAIASVTYILKDLLNNGLIDHDISNTVNTNVEITAQPPDHIDTGKSSEPTRLNLFMYMTTPNAGWRNHDLPTRNAKGDLITQPLLALDLHYLLTAYGSEEFHQEILLGYGMLLLHEHPVLTRDIIKKSLAPLTAANQGTLPPHLFALSTSGLADQIEQIKITPESLNTEEMSRLWTAFGSKYRPNAAYKVTVVLIQSQKTTKPTLPVRQRNIYAMPFHQPVIETIASRLNIINAPILDNQKILAQYLLILRGYQLKGENVFVKITNKDADGKDIDIEIKPADSDLTDNQITIPLPADLLTGVHGVQIVHKYDLGTPPVPHSGVSSNAQAFVLCPKITLVQASNVLIVNGLRSADIALTVEPAIRKDQRAVLLLNELNVVPPSQPKAYTFPILTNTLPSPPNNVATITLPTFTIQAVKSGSYLVRIQIDGAESPLENAPSGAFNNPSIILL